LNYSQDIELHDVIDLEKPAVVTHEAPAILEASKAKKDQLLKDVNHEN